MNIIININLTSFRRSGPQLGVQDKKMVALQRRAMITMLR